MEKKDILTYIDKLKTLESDLTSMDDDDDIDQEFLNELDTTLTNLSKDIQSTYGPQSLTIPIKIKKLDPSAVIPKYSKIGDAGMDLTAVTKDFDKDGNLVYGTGLAFEIPKGYVGLLFPRSSNAKKELTLTNSVGVIDSGYRGEVMLKFKPTPTFQTREKEIGIDTYEIGDRVGQIIILPYPQIEFIETDELSESERNTGGFGHTGN